MGLVAVEFNIFIKVIDHTVGAGAGETQFADFFKKGLVGAFALANHGCQDKQTRAFGDLHNVFNNFLRALFLHSAPANRTVWYADAREEQTQIVVNFGYRTHG